MPGTGAMTAGTANTAAAQPAQAETAEDAAVSSWPGPGPAEIWGFRKEYLIPSINLPSQRGAGWREPPWACFGSAWGCRRMLCLAGGPLGGQVPLPPVPEGVQLRERGQVPHHQGSLRGKEMAGVALGWSLPQHARP